MEQTGPSFVLVAEDGTEESLPSPTGLGVADVPVLSLQGYIEFASAEQALLGLRRHVADAVVPQGIVVDLDHVTGFHPVAVLLVDAIIDQLARRGVSVVTVDRQGRGMVVASGQFLTRAEALAHLRGT